MTTQSFFHPRASLDIEILSANPVNDLQFNGTAPLRFPERIDVTGEDNGEMSDEGDNQPVRVSEADGMSRAFEFFLALKGKPIRTVLKHRDLK